MKELVSVMIHDCLNDQLCVQNPLESAWGAWYKDWWQNFGHSFSNEHTRATTFFNLLHGQWAISAAPYG